MAILKVNNSRQSAGNNRRINYRDPAATNKIVTALRAFTRTEGDYRLLICIGSDRSTGDALGPIVGTFLSSLQLPHTVILGTLARPVHALNLEATIDGLHLPAKESPLVIAVDASLGKPDRVGTIEVGTGPLYPGAGVNKKLPPVGHLYLSGVVNIGGFMEQMVLQSTRLFQVMELAATIGRALHQFLAPGQRLGQRAGPTGPLAACLNPDRE